jgi:hypothetical protein
MASSLTGRAGAFTTPVMMVLPGLVLGTVGDLAGAAGRKLHSA